ncbi:class A beta-lactamase [Streptomyces katrae]|uniref:Beta-lactamase n=1 Tax=Streptomyces katrae TaxID=68223 RepID=A0A0F4JH29_9ACTN|nr:class A beta-lactamase [Streptomyces katrae]KJY33495.1 beta-lactamase [Streptomyces katrae]
MKRVASRPSRRTVLALGTGGLAALGLGAAGQASAAPRPAEGPATVRRLREMEREHGARIGVYARNLVTGRTVANRAEETFPVCSVFKPLAAAAVLRDLDRDGEFLARRVHYTAAEVEAAEWAPVTKDHVADGMTIEALCAAAVSQSDNLAGNLLLRELGGPTGITRFARSLGDRVTRLDRWEPTLNSAEPWRVEDTTSPRAIGETYVRLLLGNALARKDRDRITGWLLANTTNTQRFKAGLPGWTLADKTGGGNAYGVANDVGVVWSPAGVPVVMAVLTTRPEAPQGPNDSKLVADTARLLGEAVLDAGHA